MVFKNPRKKEQHSIKRVICLHGDKIEIKGKDLYVNRGKKNGKELPTHKERQLEAVRKEIFAFYEKGDLGTYVVIFIGGTLRKDLIISISEG